MSVGRAWDDGWGGGRPKGKIQIPVSIHHRYLNLVDMIYL